ncbi:MAG: diguanylate cyclase [Proteobacteria bacterium]|nr:diguanylate cyclase [Pseudomonadota bacterium]
MAKPPRPSAVQTKPVEAAPSRNSGPAIDLKEAYLGLAAKLEVDLSDNYLRLVTDLKTDIQRCQDPTELLAIHPRLEAVLQQYTEQVNRERRSQVAFVAEVAHKLKELEGRLAASLDRFQDGVQIKAGLDDNLDQNLASLQEALHDARRLEDIKQTVLDRLTTLQEALDQRRQFDQSLEGQVQNEITRFRDRLHGLQEELSRVEAEKKSLAHKLQFDPLTGAYTRSTFEDRLGQELDRFRRYQHPFSVIMFDVDHFKRVNDTYGHPIGDRCLREIIERVKPLLRRTDLVARYGGEEFIVILPETEKQQGAVAAEKLRSTIEATEFLVQGQRFPVTISLGVAEAGPLDFGPEDLVRRADKALYQAKEAGRNRVAVL